MTVLGHDGKIVHLVEDGKTGILMQFVGMACELVPCLEGGCCASVVVME